MKMQMLSLDDPAQRIVDTTTRVEKKFNVKGPLVRQVTTVSTTSQDPWTNESLRKDQLADPEIKSIIELKDLSNRQPSWQNMAHFHPTTERYWALWASFHLRNGFVN